MRLALLGVALASCGAPQHAQPLESAPQPERAPCAPALFCDDFEDDAVDQSPGTPWRNETGTSGATVNVDTIHAFSGEKAVHVSAPKGASYRRGYFAIHEPPVFPAASKEMYGRAMVWLDQAPTTPAGQTVHWTFIQGEGRSADDKYNSLYRYGGQHQGGLGLMANFETTPPIKSDCWQHSQARLPVQQWTCVEWRFAVATNEMSFWLDGKQLSDLHVADRPSDPEAGCLATEHLQGQWLAPPKFQSLYLGWERYQDTDNDQNLWIDDVAVSQTRIGCPAPPTP